MPAKSGGERAGSTFPVPTTGERVPSNVFVRHRCDPASTANRLIPGGFLHFESLKGGRNVVLSDVVRGGFLGEVVEHILRQPRRQLLEHVRCRYGLPTRVMVLGGKCTEVPGGEGAEVAESAIATESTPRFALVSGEYWATLACWSGGFCGARIAHGGYGKNPNRWWCRRLLLIWLRLTICTRRYRPLPRAIDGDEGDRSTSDETP